MRLALAQFDFPVGAVQANAARIVELIEQARDAHGAQLIVFPELALSGYPPEDLLLRPSFLAACDAALHAIAARCRGIVAVVGHPDSAGAVVFNAASVLRDGCIECTYRKRELPNYAVFDERRYFATGDSACLFELDGVRIGVLICEDLWYSEPIAALASAGATLVVVPNASPFETRKHAERDVLLARRVGETGLALAYVNVVGGQDELIFDGASVLADADAHIHPEARAFDEALLVADFDPAAGRFATLHWPAEDDAEDEAGLTYRALVRATGDYARKNGFTDCLLGLSGGIDSALTLAIAVDALGAAHVQACMLPSRYTSELSLRLARQQARMLGVSYQSLSIEPPFEGFLQALTPAFAGQPADVTEENLQSRCRGAALMALSNKFGGLLLTTGNKSEYAVGYATIYGDMCGGFAPLKDVYKTAAYALARYRNRVSPAIPDEVISRAPSAELRENQRDEDSLPPYATLDAMLERFIDDEQSVEEIVAAGFDADEVRRVAALVLRNEYKRRQSAPGPKVSRRAFGRERRYPISNGWRG